MSDMRDYLVWRGDLPTATVVPGGVDDFILARASYMPFDGSAPMPEDNESVKLGRIAQIVLDSAAILPLKEDSSLLALIAKSFRFGDLDVIGYRNITNSAKEEQFSATAFIDGSNELCIAFRGTDQTLVGWKEDFNMGFADSVPSQLQAVSFLEATASLHSNPIRLCGHSKGGNLAMYAAVFCSDEIRKRIVSVRNFDGPGFSPNIIASKSYLSSLPLIHTFIPQASIVGMLLDHAEATTVIRSSANGGFMQHDPYTWLIEGAQIVRSEGRTASSIFLDAALSNWIASMSRKTREEMIDGLYGVINETGVSDLQDLLSPKSAAALVRALARMDPETRTVVSNAILLLKDSAKDALTNMKRLNQSN